MRYLIAALTLTLAACGGGGSSAPEPAQQPQAACTPRVVTVALLGDSTQYGWDGETQAQAPNNPGYVLQQAMDKRFGAGAVVVTNYGVSGSRAAEAPRVQADVVVANYGINDLRLHGDLTEYLRSMKATGATIIETMNPVWLDPALPEAEWVQAAKGLGLPVADVNAYVRSLPNWQQYVPDKAHPTNQLYGMIVQNVLAPSVAQQVQPFRCQ
jgi:hypothetical protein